MTEANKKSWKSIGLSLLGLAIFAAVAHFVPDGSLFKTIFGVFVTILLVGGILFFTGWGGALYKLLFKKKEDK